MKNGVKGEEMEWEMKPGGMLVQRRDDHDDIDRDTSSSSAPMIKINVAHGSAQHEVFVPTNSTFGELKREIEQKTGLKPEVQKVLFRGKEKEENEHLHTAGVKDKAKILVLEKPASEEKVDERKENKEMSKAFAAIADVKIEVDKLAERVAALEAVVNGGTKIASEEFDVSSELLMRQLLKLDKIEAEGEAKLQRKAEVRRVQNFHETLDKLKARNSNPFSDSSKAVSVTTEWETFESGAGSLTAPPPRASSTKVTQDWEQFD